MSLFRLTIPRGRPAVALLLLGAVTCSSCVSATSLEDPATRRGEAVSRESDVDVDALLEGAAADAIGEREGCIIVMDPQNGRIRAIANPRVAFEQAFPPGSAIKPFTALAAMRAGLIDSQYRSLCRQRYASGGCEIVCSHPKSEMPFDLVRALGYSCNYYFASVGERLSEGAFDSTLASFGFGARTGVNASAESAGRLRQDEWRVSYALGEGDHLLVTPVQLLAAYAALANGGRLFRPQVSALPDFTAQEQARLNILQSHRAALIEGMRAAVKYGTAAGAGLVSLPVYVFGKTGTSTASNGFRTQGWFAGFVAPQNKGLAPESVDLAVLVFLKRAHGAECARVARPILEEFIKHYRSDRDLTASIESTHSGVPKLRSIRVRLVRENVTEAILLEDYVAGVLRAEASVEGEIEALKAQAVVSRTFALKNLGRHQADGYDFCSTTHCQRYSRLENASSQGSIKAAADTAGVVLRDERGQLVDAYFHAACGGMTADIEALWGVPGPGYLRGVLDDYCATMPHRIWTRAIAANQLAEALRSDGRTDVGARLDDVVVAQRDYTGRAASIALEGERRRIVRGWDFKLVVGRSLGWDALKSSRFEVSRNGSSFVFRGSGFGHGLGLCQEGAHVMAVHGASYEKILAHYFPGAKVAAEARNGEDLTDRETVVARLNAAHTIQARDKGPRSGMSSEHFNARYRASLEQREVESVLKALEASRADLVGRLGAASVHLVEPGPVDVIIHESTKEFIAATGQPWWAAAATRGHRIELQPVWVLRRRGVLETTLRHECAHAVIEVLGKGRVPRWLAEGLAIHVAGEGPMFSRVRTSMTPATSELERRLARPGSAEEMRALYGAAYGEVLAAIKLNGEASVWRRVAEGRY